MRAPRVLAVLAVLTSGCAAAPAITLPDLATPGRAEATRDCTALPQAVGQISDVELNEISGVVESRNTPGVFFVHNDSGDSPRFFALDRSGRVLTELVLDTVPLLIDAEEIALGPGPGGASFVYLGDTGNNFASFGVGIPRRKAVVYRIPEPRIALSARHLKLKLREAFPIVLTFPDGARDVEAMFVDPHGGELVMISKQPDGQSQILIASAELLAAGGGELRLAGRMWFGREPLAGSPMPTGASISRDGGAILVRTYSAVFLFRREAGEPVTQALARAPKILPSPREQQGESISFAQNDTAFLTISEGVKPELHCASLLP